MNKKKDPYEDNYNAEDIVKVLIVNEVEKCIKLRSGKLFKV